MKLSPFSQTIFISDVALNYYLQIVGIPMGTNCAIIRETHENCKS